MTELLPNPAQCAVFASAVFVLNATPGVDFLLTVSRTVQGGARAGVAAALGINAGCVVHALAAAFGLAALLALHPQALVAVQWAGAAYLAWLGVGMLRQAWRRGDTTNTAHASSAHPADSTSAVPASRVSRSTWADYGADYGADFRAGLLTNVLNPKVALFFLAFLPQFVPDASPHPTFSFLLLGTWFVAQGLVFLLVLVAVVVAAATRLSRLRASHATRRVLNALGGGLFIALALRVVSQRPVVV